jgi:integrase
MKLTAKYVENVRPDPVRREIADAGCAGLYLLLQPSGHRSWAVRYRINGKSKKLTIGSWPEVSLLDARVAAAAARKQVKLGNDPARAMQDAKVKADAAKADTVTAICERYLALEGRKLRTVDQRVSILRRLVYPALGAMPIDSVRRSDVVRLLDKVETGAGPRMSDVTLATLRRIFHWHETRTDEWRSPIIRGMGSRQNTVEHRRTRVLSDDEIRAVWAATADGSPFASLVRLALLTSARRNEIAGMRWDEIEGDVWTLPASRSKTKTAITRPLSRTAIALLDGLPRIDGCPFVFTSNGVTPIASFSEPKRKLDLASAVTGWRIHDLRRTARSLLSRCKDVSVDHAERVLGHALPGIRATYDRHTYAEEIHFAVEALAQMIETIIHPPEGEVADIGAERSKRRQRR